MERITLTNEQLHAVSQSDPVAVYDEHGQLRGYISMVISSEELAEARRALASPGPRYTTAQVLDKLRERGAP